MSNSNHIAAIAELSESEGVFTTAQAGRMGISRDALHDAVQSGRLERIMRGAYRMVGSGSSYLDELAAVWKLTAPSKLTHERMRFSEWDGVVVGGHTASSLLGFGDFHLSPYRLYAPMRVNTRKLSVSFSKRGVSRDEAMFFQGLPVTRPERTIFDLVLDEEDSSLVAGALRDAALKGQSFDFGRLSALLRSTYKPTRADAIFEGLMADAGLTYGEAGR